MGTSTSARVTKPAPARMSRRVLLGGAVGAGLLGAAGRPARVARAQSGPADLATSPRKVLVLGAGMAGLTAAVALLRRGHDVTVIEYQNRVGGRLLSLPLQGVSSPKLAAGISGRICLTSWTTSGVLTYRSSA